MESLLKKYQQKYRKAKDEMEKWDQLQSRLLVQIRNASSIIQRLQMLQESKNYGGLKSVSGVREELIGKQMCSLELILQSLKQTMKEFHSIVLSLEKTHRDGKHLSTGASRPLTEKQMLLRLGIQPTIADCVEGLKAIHEMHQSEYLLKLSVVSFFISEYPLPSASDLSALQQLLIDQPNIPKDEVQSILDIIFAEEIC